MRVPVFAAALALACISVTEALPARAADLADVAARYEHTNPGHWSFPWCAAFIRAILPEAGLAAPRANNLASSFLSLPRTTAHRGAIAIVYGGAHVAIVVEVTQGGVVLLSGNGRGHVVHRGLYPRSAVTAYVEPQPAGAAPALAAIGRLIRHGNHRRHHHRSPR